MPCRDAAKRRVRVIYYWLKDNHQHVNLVVYPKSKKDNLTDKETAILRGFVKVLCAWERHCLMTWCKA